MEASRGLKTQDLRALNKEGQLTDVFDGGLHLDAHLKAKKCTGTVEEDGRGLSGVLKNGQELELALEATLSEDALRRHYDENSSDHRTLDNANGVVVELELRWVNARNKAVASRVLYAPVAITTRSWWLYGLIIGAVGVVLFGGGGLWGYRKWKRRGQARAQEAARRRFCLERGSVRAETASVFSEEGGAAKGGAEGRRSSAPGPLGGARRFLTNHLRERESKGSFLLPGEWPLTSTPCES